MMRKTKKQISSKLQKLWSNFKCGTCKILFDSAYLLHDHMRDHVEGGSYYYNNTIQTAFPTSVSAETGTQTCQSDLEDEVADSSESVAKIKPEEFSDTNSYGNGIDWNSINDDLSDAVSESNKSESTKNKTNETQHSSETQHISGDKIGMADAGSKRKVVCDNSVSKSSKRDRKSSCPLKYTKQIAEPYLDIMNTFAKQNSLTFREASVSLPRIDHLSTVPDSENHQIELKKHKTDVKHKKYTAFRGRKVKMARFLKAKKTPVKKTKTKVTRKTAEDYVPDNDNEYTPDEEDLSDQEYKPDKDEIDAGISEEESTEPCMSHFEDDSDIIDENNEDPHWNLARIECLNMKCKHCDKFVESAFSKANLLALHNIPFQQQNGRIIIKSRKILSSEHGGKEIKEENEMEFVIDKEAAKETFICEQCGAVCVDRNNFRRHKKIHTNHSMVCPHCDFTPTSKNHFKAHLKTHKSEFRCSFCGNLFKQKKHLVCHERSVHLGHKRFVCDICGKSFYSRASMQEHRRSHFPPALQCSYCDKKLTNSSSKRRHEKIHTGQKQFVCHICNHGFIQSTPYWVHMQKQHGISKVEAIALRSKHAYENKVIAANFKRDSKDESLISLEAAEEACKL